MTWPSNAARTPSMNDEIVKPLRRGAAHLVIEHDGFHAGLVRHATDVARRRVRLGDVTEDALGIAGVGRLLGAAHVVLVSAVVHDLADEHVGAARETHDVRGVRRVAGEANRPRARLEAVAERAMLHVRDEPLGEMRVGRGRHDDAVVGEHAHGFVARVDVVTEEQRFRRTVRPSSTMRISTLARKNAIAPSTVRAVAYGP